MRDRTTGKEPNALAKEGSKFRRDADNKPIIDASAMLRLLWLDTQRGLGSQDTGPQSQQRRTTDPQTSAESKEVDSLKAIQKTYSGATTNLRKV
jgi:hypothetical protein